MFLFIMLFFLPKIMQKACQRSYDFDYQVILHK